MTLTGAEIRDKFVAYFRDKRGHLHLPSASLIPDNPTLLLTSAGMVPFVPIFLGQAPPPTPPRAVTIQKSARAGGKDSDIENIGRTARHHSFFEMLGNFSFGDYFKKEVIPWAWEFVTKELGLEPEKLSVSIFKGDDQNPADEEAFEIWHKHVGLPVERIHRLSRKDNFWGPPGPTGPCGPCTELYYDRGVEYGCSTDPQKCGIGICECDRYMEFWNLVLMEFFKDEESRYTPLANKNVDTGAGLERVAMILQKKFNVYETDLLFPILQEAAQLAKTKYTGKGANAQESKTDLYLKIITDHARCVTFLVSDGVRTSNIGRGYVLRFIIRRAARFGRLLGLTDPFVYKLVPKVISLYGHHYKELQGAEETIANVIKAEEERFAKTIDRGMSLLEELLASSSNQIAGQDAFKLYATYGFPLELTREIAVERGKTIDEEGFKTARKEHEEVSSVNKFNVIITGEEALGKILKEQGSTKFLGYKDTEGSGEIVAILQKGKLVEGIAEGDEADIVLNQTPFYAESGGQVGDTGVMRNTDATASVLDTKKHEGLHLHRIKTISGELQPGNQIQTLVDRERRSSTVLHHSTAHLFHAAAREVLGKSVVQAGSQVGPETMRFDFTLERQPTPVELSQIENMMNEWVRLNLPVTTKEMSLEDAKKTGAIAMFGEKYGNIVRVISMGDVSLEFCGGTHVKYTGEIGPIKLISEGSIASGVRRVEALSGPKAWHFIAQHMSILSLAADKLKIRPEDLLSQIDRLQDQLKQKEKQTQLLSEKLALSNTEELLSKAKTIGSVQLISEIVPDLQADALKTLADNLRQQRNNLIVVLATELANDKVSIIAAVSEPLVNQGFNASNIAKEAAAKCGGTGGGRPQLAQAGGKDPSQLKQALAAAKALVEEAINAKA